jgi:Raf kinase inhibitor-like YbhB/YbcL family protein
MALTLHSPAFNAHAPIPVRFTCQGENCSPELRWEGIPAGTRSLALIVDDPDAPDPAAPKMTWVHWVLYNLPPDTQGLLEAVRQLPPGTQEGVNDWKRTGYGGPCPPIGQHRYFFKLYALDTVLPNLHHPTAERLRAAMRGQILGHAELVGVYRKS